MVLFTRYITNTDQYGPKTETPNTTTVLLDNTGKVIAYDKSGVELQWYLSKILGE